MFVVLLFQLAANKNMHLRYYWCYGKQAATGLVNDSPFLCVVSGQ